MTSFSVADNTTQTARIDMQGNDDLTVGANAFLSVSANAQAVRFQAPTNGATILNNGTIEATGVQAEPRAIRFENGVGATLNVTITNNGLIDGIDDAIGIQGSAGVTAGTGSIQNTATIESTNGQAIDFAGGTGAFITDVNSTGTIRSLANDAIRIGGVGQILSFGVINGGSDAAYSGADGIQFEDSASGTVDHFNDAGGFLSGDRHGINAGVGSNITVTNGASGGNTPTITGRNGSGVGSDGTATIINYGLIQGNFDPGATDINGGDGIVDGDGDGIDVDFQATIENFGTIEGTGAGGTGSDGLANTSEGIAAGGGTITNHLGATIEGAGLGILIDDSSQGNAPFVTNLLNEGTITGGTSFAVRIISNLADAIDNDGTITGGAGTAIQFGSGNNRLGLRANSVITGISVGGLGTDTLDYSQNTNLGRTVDLGAGTADETGGVSGFENAIGNAGDDDFTGDAVANQFTGGDGADTLAGAAGNDVLIGGVGGDNLAGGANLDTINYSNSSAAVTININTGAAFGGDAAGDIFSLIENVSGSVHADSLTGSAGANVLNGYKGADTLAGMGSNDTYVVDDLGDLVVEFGGDGYDTIKSTVTIATLAANVERGILGGSADLDLTGNGENNALTGNDGGNDISGAVGNDLVRGGGGADGLTGDGGVDRLYGEAGADTLGGGADEDSLVGGGGRDVMTGGGDRDRFIFLSAADLGFDLATADRITDFVRADGDRMILTEVDADSTTGGDQAFSFLTAQGAAFGGIAGQLRFSHTTDGGNNVTLVEGDTDGNGVADITLVLAGHLNLIAKDFYL